MKEDCLICSEENSVTTNIKEFIECEYMGVVGEVVSFYRECSVCGVSASGEDIDNFLIEKRKFQIDTELDILHKECCKENWDGDNADKVTIETIRIARKFLFLLAEDKHPLPEIAPEATGTISLDWTIDRLKYLSVSVSPENRKLISILSLGKNERFSDIIDFKDQLPELFLQRLKKLYE